MALFYVLFLYFRAEAEWPQVVHFRTKIKKLFFVVRAVCLIIISITNYHHNHQYIAETNHIYSS
jgi:hypothetical protein